MLFVLLNLARTVAVLHLHAALPVREQRSAATIELSAHISLRWQLPGKQHLGADTQEELSLSCKSQIRDSNLMAVIRHVYSAQCGCTQE